MVLIKLIDSIYTCCLLVIGCEVHRWLSDKSKLFKSSVRPRLSNYDDNRNRNNQRRDGEDKQTHTSRCRNAKLVRQSSQRTILSTNNPLRSWLDNPLNEQRFVGHSPSAEFRRPFFHWINYYSKKWLWSVWDWCFHHGFPNHIWPKCSSNSARTGWKFPLVLQV